MVVSTQHREITAKGKKYNSGMIKEMIAGHVAKSLPAVGCGKPETSR